MKNKIALFTWCYTNGPVNYGQILQCYSLQRVCTELGYEVNVLKYRKLQNNENIDDIPYKGAGRDAYEYAFKNKNIQSQLSKQVIRVNEFINENVKMTKQCYCIEDVLEEIDDSDILIVGSDQLWNPQWLDTIYLLPFKEDKKRISYATSGIFFDDEQAKGIADMIKHFDYLSVREPISKSILNRYIERDIFCALDPVFLLDSKNWDEIGGKEICDEALKLFPEKNFPYYYTGCYYFGVKDFKKSIESFEKAVKINPEDYNSVYFLATINERFLNDRKKAIYWFKYAEKSKNFKISYAASKELLRLEGKK